ncbi:MAG: oligoendopeptidase, partial [Thermoleophilia bacterium]|nr:oligoendopeptidase [Thermoleophilia bacterium]
MKTSYLPDLSHRTPTPQWLPEDLPAQLEPDWVRVRYDEVLAACDAAGDDADAWIDVVLRTSELESLIGSHGSRVRIAYRQDTDDAVITRELERWNREVSPVVTDASIEVARRVVASPASAALTERFGPTLLLLAEAACRAHAPVNTALRTELSDVLMRHTRVFGKGTIEWRGETHPFSFARKAALDTDREHRHAAWESKVDYVRDHETELQEIFDEAMVLRRKMAENLGQPSFVDLRYLEMSRFDWTPADAAKVRGAIEHHVVPIATELQLRQAAALGTERLHPADEAIMPDPAPALSVEVDGQLEAATTVIDAK